MPAPAVLKKPWLRLGIVAVIIAAGLAAMALPPVRDSLQGFFSGLAEHKTDDAEGKEALAAEYFEDQGHQALRLSQAALDGLEVNTVPALKATKERPLPPQIGTLNYDNDRLFVIRSRFPGELADVHQVVDTDAPITPSRQRPMRFGDKLKQGDLLGVIWSQQLGTAKAALVDAICALRLSQDNYKRYEKLSQTGSIPEATLRQAERQVQQDSNTELTAYRSLKFWKLTPDEIKDIEAEANILMDQKKVRSADQEMKWARVELRVPVFDKSNPNRELVLVEKNTNLNDMVDPINSPPLFKLADTSRLQIWVHPPEETLPLMREGLEKNGRGRLQWDIRFQSDPPNTPPRKLDIIQIAPSLEPNQHTPMVLGYLPNPEGKYLIGQFVTATIYMPPDEDTVEIPTNALNEVEGQALVFVQKDAAKNEYFIRRVPVLHRFKDVTFVRTRLTAEDKKTSAAEVALGRRPLEPLMPGERVIIRGVVELTAALEDLATKDKIARAKSQKTK